jgi:hypothetical protein
MNITDLPCLNETVEKLRDFPWNDLSKLTAPMALEILDIRLLLVPSKGKYAGNVVVRISPEVNKFNANSLVALAVIYTLAKDNSVFVILKGNDKVTNEPMLYFNQPKQGKKK